MQICCSLRARLLTDGINLLPIENAWLHAFIIYKIVNKLKTDENMP